MKNSIKRSLKSRQIGLVQTYHLISGTDAAAASLVEQDITFSAAVKGSAGNEISIEYKDGATAGSEVVTVTGNLISIQIEDGVSTATQVKAAFDGESDATDLATATISGTAGNAQDVFAESNLSGGVDPADSGLDKAYVDNIVPLGVGNYKINMIEPARLDLVVAGIISLTDRAVFVVEAVDKSSVTIQAKDDANSAIEADFGLTLVHSKLVDAVS